MLTYEEATKCPRCGRISPTRVEEEADEKGVRLAMSRCTERSCTYYAKVWFFALDPENEVLYHTLYNT